MPGICPEKAPGAAAADCSTVITRAQFDEMLTVIAPNAPPGVRAQLANQIIRTTVMAHAAQSRGVGSAPADQQVLRFARMEVLSQLLDRRLRAKAEQITPEAVEFYYKGNDLKFQEAKLQRIVVPRNQPASAPKMSDADRAKLAQQLHERAVKGEDFQALQREAYEKLQMAAQPPSVDLGTRRRGTLNPAHEEVIFALQPGGISPVLSDGEGDYIYKLESKRTLPLDEVRDNIKQILAAEAYRRDLQQIFGDFKPVLNEQYFKTGAPPAPPQAPTMTQPK